MEIESFKVKFATYVGDSTWLRHFSSESTAFQTWRKMDQAPFSGESIERDLLAPFGPFGFKSVIYNLLTLKHILPLPSLKDETPLDEESEV